MFVVNVIRNILKGPEKKFIYISFQNILNTHYDTVFDVIYCFDNISLKDAKEFSVFKVKEMPQDLDKITFSDNYKKAVDKFYEMLSKNPTCTEKFSVLLDTLPHEKNSAVFLLKLKLRSKKMMGGGLMDLDSEETAKKLKKMGQTSANMMRVMHALYATSLSFLIIFANNAFESALNVEIPYEAGRTNEGWDVPEGSRAPSAPSGAPPSAPHAPAHSAPHASAHSAPHASASHAPAHSAHASASHAPAHGTHAPASRVTVHSGGTLDDKYYQAVLPIATTISTNTIDYISDIYKKMMESDGIRGFLDLFSVDSVIDKLNVLGMSVVGDTMFTVDTTELLSDLINFIGMQTVNATYVSDIQRKTDEKTIRSEIDVYRNNLKTTELELQTLVCDIKKKYIQKGITTFDEILLRELNRENAKGIKFECQQGGNDINKQLEKIKNTFDNTKTNETPLEGEMYYIVSISMNIQKIVTFIDSTSGNSLSELKKNRLKIIHDYNALKRQFDTFQKLLDKDKNLKN